MEPIGNMDLYNHAQEMMEEAYKKDIWSKKRWEKKLGHLLQNVFNKKDIWTLKDLDDYRLLKIMEMADFKIKKTNKNGKP